MKKEMTMKNDTMTKRAVIVGATSGIGREVALCLLKKGWKLGLAGRRLSLLQELKQRAPGQIEIQMLDVTDERAEEALTDLIERLGGMNLFLLSSGIGFQNTALRADIELNTVRTNVEGFTRLVDAAFRYFKAHNDRHCAGQLAVISSIAGTKGLGVAPAYSATKRFQNTYIDALEQLANLQHLNLHFTDIRPGFVATDLLNDGKQYPLLMQVESVAKRITRALERKERVVVIDGRYRVLVFFWRLIPRWLWKRLPIQVNDKS
ncbi:oxidoreductase, short chain dehydrogenase/reductase family protein [gut metagenome]|uniref:Oxidoreductase, short chain dehydrogenase/reductase family protein n=1 Tax=gut metagenome TaxID=749906 RepID=J9H0F2_9ZZZZ